MSSRRSGSPHSNSDRLSDSSVESDVSNFAVPALVVDISPRSSAKHSVPWSSPPASRSRGSPRHTMPSHVGSFASPSSPGNESPSISSPRSNFSPKAGDHSVSARSPKELFGVGPSSAPCAPSPAVRSSRAPSPAVRSSPRSQQSAPLTFDADKDTEEHSRLCASANMKDYLDDPLMALRTNREHGDLVIRERDDEPHLRFMSLYFTPATAQAVNAFKSDWSEERDALLQDDVFSSNKRAAFFCLFSDKQSLQSPQVRSHILRPSEMREAAASDPDASAAQSFSGIDANGAASLRAATPTAVTPAASSSHPIIASDATARDCPANFRCHTVLHNMDSGASALCSMLFGAKDSAAESLVDLPEVPQLPSFAKHARPGQPRKGRPPSVSSHAVTDLPSPSTTEIRPYSCVNLGNLGKEKTKCCIVPSMQPRDHVDLHEAVAPDMITPALGNVGQCSLEDFEEFYSKEWDALGSIDREIRFQQLQLLKVVKKNTVGRNAVADALQAEIVAKSEKQQFPVADQKNIETALTVSSRSRQLQITMEAGLQPRHPGVLLPGDPESEGDDAVCCVCFCGESLDGNQIVFCEGCNMAVHQSCYGIKNIPDGDWFCDCCVLSCKPTCVICHKKDGAFKVCVGARNSAGTPQADNASGNGIHLQSPRDSKQWVHVMCALWHPEVSFESLAIMREADITRAEYFTKKTCVFCHQNGYLMSCSGKCRQQYHPMCAWLGGWFIEHAHTQNKNNHHSVSRKRESELTAEAVLQLALLANTKYVPPMTVAAKCQHCLEPASRKAYDLDYNCKVRRLLSQAPTASGSKASKRGSAAVLEDDSGRRMLHLVRRTFLPPDEFPPGACMVCHFDVHNENRRKLRRSRLLVCSRGCGASVHESCANLLPDDICVDADGCWTCMLCMEQESLGAVECMLCPRRGGLFQRCSEYPGWLHCICARLLCNVKPGFKGFSVSEAVTTGTMIQDYRDAKSKKVCCVCRQPGKVLHCCAHPGCEKHMHPICSMIKECKTTVDTAKNGKNNCSLFCAQHSPVADFAEADARAFQADVKAYSRLLDIRVYLDKMRDLVNFCKRRERWKYHLDSVESELFDQYERRVERGDASLCSAAILAPPLSEGEPVLDKTIPEYDDVAGDVFLPKKRERHHAIWFDVPNRGGIGMLHVAKRKCPHIMFRYLNHLSKADGREGWVFPNGVDDKLRSPTKMLQHQFRSGKTIFPPSPLAHRSMRQSKDSVRNPSGLDAFPPSPINGAKERLTRSSPRGISFGAAAKSNARLDSSDSEGSNSSSADSVHSGTADAAFDHAVVPAGTKINIRHGRYRGKTGTIVSYSGIGWFAVALKCDGGEPVKVRKAEFRVASD